MTTFISCSDPNFLDEKIEGKITKKDTGGIQKDNTSKTNFNETDTSLLGDINADNISDTAFIIIPKFVNPKDLSGGCVDNKCEIKVKFSNGLPSLTIEQAISAGVFNIGDINKDGVCEIMLCPGWFQSCWGTMRLYSLRNNTWKEFGIGSGFMCIEEDITKRIKIINKHTIEISEDVLNDEGERIKKTKTISL